MRMYIDTVMLDFHSTVGKFYCASFRLHFGNLQTIMMPKEYIENVNVSTIKLLTTGWQILDCF